MRYNINKSNLEEAQEIYDKALDDLLGEDEQTRHSYANHTSGLDGIEYEFYLEKENLKKRYIDFFDLYSKSILVALYSLIESKFKELCEITSIEFNKKIKYEHLDSRDYLKSSIIYFNLVIEMPTDSLEPFISKLTDIQFIRNRIIHSESKFINENEQRVVEIVKKANGELELIKDDSVGILKIKNPKFITDFFELIRELFEELIWLIDIQQNNKILGKGLEYWFGLLDKNIFLRNIKIIRLAKGKRSIEFDLSSRKKNVPRCKCRISLARRNKNSLEVINQTESESINDFIEFLNSVNQFIFDYVFELLNLSEKGLKINVMIY